MNIIKKPSLGVEPEYIWRKQRIQNINEAMKIRFYSEEIPTKWIEERNKHILWLAEYEEILKNKKEFVGHKAITMSIHYDDCVKKMSLYERDINGKLNGMLTSYFNEKYKDANIISITFDYIE